MVFGLIGMVLSVLAVILLPAGIYAGVKLVNRLFTTSPAEGPTMLSIDIRLRRMEEAIDAMSQQIERMRTGDHYVSRGADDMPLLPPSDDPPSFS